MEKKGLTPLKAMDGTLSHIGVVLHTWAFPCMENWDKELKWKARAAWWSAKSHRLEMILWALVCWSCYWQVGKLEPMWDSSAPSPTGIQSYYKNLSGHWKSWGLGRSWSSKKVLSIEMDLRRGYAPASASASFFYWISLIHLHLHRSCNSLPFFSSFKVAIPLSSVQSLERG